MLNTEDLFLRPGSFILYSWLKKKNTFVEFKINHGIVLKATDELKRVVKERSSLKDDWITVVSTVLKLNFITVKLPVESVRHQ